MTAKFTVLREGAPTVVVVGEVDFANATELGAALAEVGDRVVVELSQTSYLDSAGLRVLFAHARRSALELVLRRGGPVEQVVELSGLTELAAVRYS
ncbi:STAS domain-containing protein [Allokutzneria oryzae]|uniref:STAS domain-containing protein n=1 Tax=Allokutzneria oryzae TaxID=1378989 RepID=A0ABV6A6K2_9PSEU